MTLTFGRRINFFNEIGQEVVEKNVYRFNFISDKYRKVLESKEFGHLLKK